VNSSSGGKSTGTRSDAVGVARGGTDHHTVAHKPTGRVSPQVPPMSELQFPEALRTSSQAPNPTFMVKDLTSAVVSAI
jgi:hypothetical protein